MESVGDAIITFKNVNSIWSGALAQLTGACSQFLAIVNTDGDNTHSRSRLATLIVKSMRHQCRASIATAATVVATLALACPYVYGQELTSSAAKTVTVHQSKAKAASSLDIPVTIAHSPIMADVSEETHPASLFDSAVAGFNPVITTVEVKASMQDSVGSEPDPVVIGGQEIVSSAGTFGDISRFLQTLPGVASPSDLSNALVVRGGNPTENLFIVDGIEVPNINHVATLGTTGGFGPMIDSAMVQSVKFYTGGYSAQFPERLSSVTEINTLDGRGISSHLEGDFGIEGFGGMIEQRLYGGHLLVAAHHGVMDSFGKSLGIDDIPSYNNELTRYRREAESGDKVTLLNVAGNDSIEEKPCAADPIETTSIDSQYHGVRETTGIEWQHIYSKNSIGILTISDSEQIEHIHQQDQLLVPSAETIARVPCPIPASSPWGVVTPVYAEDSNNGFSTASYRFEKTGGALSFAGGSSFWLQRPRYNIQQPIGAYSPYSVNPVRADSTSFDSSFATGESGTFVEMTFRPVKGLSATGGVRMQTFALGDHLTFTPRLSARYQAGEYLEFHAAYASYAQTPPTVDLLSYRGNRTLLPVRATHQIVGMSLSALRSSQISVEAYNKNYRDVPSSTEYPSVNLNDMVDMLGQQFVWLPLISQGRGNASGVEISDVTRVGSSFRVRASVAYSRAKFEGLDRVMRPSNYDYPWIANVSAVQEFRRGFELTSRFAFVTGRPWTPYDLVDSTLQNRPIYDVTRVNQLRAPDYIRLDFQVNKDVLIRSVHLKLYCGVDNVTNHSNFLSYVWLPREHGRRGDPTPYKELDQMPIFPSGGIRFIIH